MFDDLPLNQQTPMPTNDNPNDIGPLPTKGRTFSQGEVHLFMICVFCALYYVFQNVDVPKGSSVSPNKSAVLCRYSKQAKWPLLLTEEGKGHKDEAQETKVLGGTCN